MSEDLARRAREIRKSVLRMLSRAGSGHTGGSLGMADAFAESGGAYDLLGKYGMTEKEIAAAAREFVR